MNIREWLNEEPDVADLVEVSLGVFTHPYESIVKKLYILCPDGWDTQNFRHQFVAMPDGSIKVSGSIEVVLEYGIESTIKLESMHVPGYKVRRILTGAATFSTSDYSNEHETNEHFAATLKSLCVVNAVQTLGRQMGMGLNSTTLPTQHLDGEPIRSKFQKKVREAVKVDPDEGIRLQWNEAVNKNAAQKIRFLFGMYNITPGENGYLYVNTNTDGE